MAIRPEGKKNSLKSNIEYVFAQKQTEKKYLHLNPLVLVGLAVRTIQNKDIKQKKNIHQLFHCFMSQLF